MRSPGNFNPEWGYLAPAPSFMRTARAVLVATAIGATAGVAVVIALIDRPAEDGNKTTPVAAHPIVTSAEAAAPTEPPAPTVAVSSVAPAAAGIEPAPAAVAPLASVPAAAPVAAAKVVAPSAAAPAALGVPAAAAPAQPGTPQIMAPEATPQIAPKVTVQPPSTAAAQAAAMPAPTKDAEAPAEDARANAEANTAPPPKPAAGIAALSAGTPTRGAVRTDAPDEGLIPPQTVPPEKKTRHHVASSYTQGGINGVLQRVFGRRRGTSYYPDH